MKISLFIIFVAFVVISFADDVKYSNRENWQNSKELTRSAAAEGPERGDSQKLFL
jgi:hypothetical protein